MQVLKYFRKKGIGSKEAYKRFRKKIKRGDWLDFEEFKAWSSVLESLLGANPRLGARLPGSASQLDSGN